MIENYFKVALRHMRSNAVFTIINFGGLSIGLACCMLILLYVNQEISYDRFHLNKDHLYQLVCERSEGDGNKTAFSIAALVQGPAFQKAIPEIQDYIRVNPRDVVVKRNNRLFNEIATWVDPKFFQVFSFPLLFGNARAALEQENSVVLTESTADKYFGTTQIIGKVLQLDMGGRFEPFVVTAIARDPPQNSSIQFNLLLSFRHFEQLNPDNGWMWVSFPTYFMLSPHARPETIAAKMDQVYKVAAKDEIDLNHLAGYQNGFKWGLEPMMSMHLNTDYTGTPGGSNPVYALVLIAVAVFILLIACINFVNITVGLSLKRSREIGVRKVAGSSRIGLILQFLTESMLLCLGAFTLALVLTVILLPLFNEVTNKQISFRDLIDFKFCVALSGLFLLTGLAAGCYPAFVLSGFRPIEALAGNAGNRKSGVLVNMLVVLQFSLSTLLIISTLFIHAQFDLLTQSDLGYPDQDLVAVSAGQGAQPRAAMELYRSEFEKVPRVAGVGYSNPGHFGGKTQASGKEFSATYVRVDENYLPTLGVKIIAGRNFSSAFPSDSSSSALVNETLVKSLGWTRPVGQNIDYMNIPGWAARKLSVIGVVSDYHSESLREKIQPMIFIQDPSIPLGNLLVRLAPGLPANTLINLEKIYGQMDPVHPFRYRFLKESHLQSYSAENRWRQLLSFGAAATIVVSGTGLFGLALLSARRRRREIAVRKVLGASVSRLAAMLCADFTRLVFLSFILSVPIGWWLVRRWLQNFAYRVDLTWWRFCIAGIIALIVALLTVSYQAIKAARANPVISLRNE